VRCPRRAPGRVRTALGEARIKPDQRFLKQPRHFWANVRTIGQAVGYTARRKRQIKVPTFQQIKTAYMKLGLRYDHLFDAKFRPTELGTTLQDYFAFRAERLNTFVEPRLMDAAKARKVFEEHRARLKPKCAIPMNKQKGKKKAPAYLTGLVNMLIEANSGASPCDYDPRALTTVTRDGIPLRTLARRVDGAFPGTVNPIAVWEVKEYYYTTTFGSRVDESLLDGIELEELLEHEKIHVLHYLMVDAHYTWWDCGKSYLCRIIDMLHMGYVDEVLFGYEVVERLPTIVGEWCAIAKQRGK
jgi:hypothetical protein